MGIWIEFRCENREDESAKGARDHCHSHDNAGPMEMADDTQKSVLDTLRIMEKGAIAGGWKRTRFGWYCPYCAKATGQKN